MQAVNKIAYGILCYMFYTCYYIYTEYTTIIIIYPVRFWMKDPTRGVGWAAAIRLGKGPYSAH